MSIIIDRLETILGRKRNWWECRKKKKESFRTFMKRMKNSVSIGAYENRRLPRIILGDWIAYRDQVRLRRIEEWKQRELWIKEHPDEALNMAREFFEEERRKRLERRIARVKRQEKRGQLTTEEAERIIKGLGVCLRKS